MAIDVNQFMFDRVNQTGTNNGLNPKTFGSGGINFPVTLGGAARPINGAAPIASYQPQNFAGDILDNYIGSLNLPQNNQAAASTVSPAPVEAAATPIPQPVQAPVTPTTSQPVVDAEALRNEALQRVNTTFGSNYGDRVISDNFLDDAINNMLAEQQGTAQQYLDRGKARGIYNDVGYNAGLNTVNSGVEAGKSKIAELARGVLDKYQSRANTVRDDAYNAASTVNTNNPFDFEGYVSRGEGVVNDANRYAGGDLKNAFGGTQLFDFGQINNKAGQAQGALNLRDTDLATAVRERNRVDTQQRGIGNTGAF